MYILITISIVYVTVEVIFGYFSISSVNHNVKFKIASKKRKYSLFHNEASKILKTNINKHLTKKSRECGRNVQTLPKSLLIGIELEEE